MYDLPVILMFVLLFVCLLFLNLQFPFWKIYIYILFYYKRDGILKSKYQEFLENAF